MRCRISNVSVAIVASLLTWQCVVAKEKDRYSNSWAVEVRGGAEKAEELARKHGFTNLGQVGNLVNIYHFMLAESTQHDLSKRAIYSLSVVGEKSEKTTSLQEEENVGFIEQQKLKRHEKKGYTVPSDPGWSQQWALENTGQTRGPSSLDLNVEPVWMQGITGRGVVVAFVDDGLEHSHPDLSANYDSAASYDFAHHDSNPTPDYNADEPNRHGTSCAGEVGMAKGNGHCGVGVAYECNIGSLKQDNSQSSDLTEADALGFKDSYVHVYSNSWGPLDFGFFVKGPGTLVKRTFETATREGRGGKGNIYVWAAGNGGRYFDSCAADGYASSIYTIAIGSADQNAGQADYDEQCASKMAVTFSYNSATFPSADDTWKPHNQIYTTTLNGQCTSDFTGTSAAAPLASGVVALALQANPNIMWRDVQYLIAYTSNSDILHNGEWTTNGAGLPVSHMFGFGAIDAEAMVTRARRWTNVPDQLSYSLTPTVFDTTASYGSPISVSFNISTGSTVRFLEHVVVKMSLALHGYSRGYDYQDLSDYLQSGSKQESPQESFDFDYFFDDKTAMNEERDVYDWLGNSHTKRGDIKVELTSPWGTKSVLLPYRKYDFVNENGYVNWPFMTVHHWGESPVGTWTLKISFKSFRGYVSMSRLGVTLYGVATTPASVSSIPLSCNAACARGCSGPGAGDCDTCRHFRVAETLECVGICPSNTIQHKKYCLTDPNSPNTSPPTDTPPTTSTPTTSPPNTSPPDTSPPNTSPTDASPPSTSPPDTSPPNTSPTDASPPSTSPPDTSPPNTSTPDTFSATSSSSNSKTKIVLSVSLPVAFIIALVVIVTIIIISIYYWKRKARSTEDYQFIALEQEPENV